MPHRALRFLNVFGESRTTLQSPRISPVFIIPAGALVVTGAGTLLWSTAVNPEAATRLAGSVALFELLMLGALVPRLK